MRHHQEKLVMAYRKFDQSDFKGDLPSVDGLNNLLAWCSDRSDEIAQKARLQVLYNIFREKKARDEQGNEGGSGGRGKKKRARKKSFITKRGEHLRELVDCCITCLLS